MTINEVIRTIRNHASIRQFEDRDVSDELIHEIALAGQQAAFTGQMYTCIYTRDAEKRQRLSKLFGPLPARGPVFMLYCVDYRKLEKFIASKGRENKANDLMMLFLGVQDVAYFAQNMVLAAESLGLGAVMLGAEPFRRTQRHLRSAGSCLPRGRSGAGLAGRKTRAATPHPHQVRSRQGPVSRP